MEDGGHRRLALRPQRTTAVTSREVVVISSHRRRRRVSDFSQHLIEHGLQESHISGDRTANVNTGLGESDDRSSGKVSWDARQSPSRRTRKRRARDGSAHLGRRLGSSTNVDAESTRERQREVGEDEIDRSSRYNGNGHVSTDISKGTLWEGDRSKRSSVHRRRLRGSALVGSYPWQNNSTLDPEIIRGEVDSLASTPIPGEVMAGRGASSQSVNSSATSTLMDFKKHDKTADLEYYVKAGIGCTVLLGFVIWYLWSFWCNARLRRGCFRRGGGGRNNHDSLQRTGSLDSQFSTIGSISSSGIYQRDARAAAEGFVDAAHFADGTQFLNPMWAERHGRSYPTPGGMNATTRAGEAMPTPSRRGVCSYTADDFPMPGFKECMPAAAQKAPSRSAPPLELHALGEKNRAWATRESVVGWTSARVQGSGGTQELMGDGESREVRGERHSAESSRRRSIGRGHDRVSAADCNRAETACFKDDM